MGPVKPKFEKAIINEVFDDDEHGKGGGGRPDNPGAHGRMNAEYKKATNPGKGGEKNSSLGGELIGEILDEDKKDERRKNGKNGKNGNTNKNKGKGKDKSRDDR